MFSLLLFLLSQRLFSAFKISYCLCVSRQIPMSTVLSGFRRIRGPEYWFFYQEQPVFSVTTQVKTFRCDNKPLLCCGWLLRRVAANGRAVTTWSDALAPPPAPPSSSTNGRRLIASHLSLLLHGIYSLFVEHIKKKKKEKKAAKLHAF